MCGKVYYTDGVEAFHNCDGYGYTTDFGRWWHVCRRSAIYLFSGLIIEHVIL